jgi:hypothetical protein
LSTSHPEDQRRACWGAPPQPKPVVLMKGGISALRALERGGVEGVQVD